MAHPAYLSFPALVDDDPEQRRLDLAHLCWRRHAIVELNPAAKLADRAG